MLHYCLPCPLVQMLLLLSSFHLSGAGSAFSKVKVGNHACECVVASSTVERCMCMHAGRQAASLYGTKCSSCT
jgi:hypothetical protein